MLHRRLVLDDRFYGLHPALWNLKESSVWASWQPSPGEDRSSMHGLSSLLLQSQPFNPLLFLAFVVVVVLFPVLTDAKQPGFRTAGFFVATISSRQQLRVNEDNILPGDNMSQAEFSCTTLLSCKLALCSQDSVDLVGVRSQKFSVKVAGIGAGSECCKFQVTRAGWCLSPVYAKQGTGLHDIASQSNKKVISDVHYYNYNQVIISGVD